MADLTVRHLVQASLCSFRRVSSRRFVSPMYTLPQVHGTSKTTICVLFDGAFVTCRGFCTLCLIVTQCYVNTSGKQASIHFSLAACVFELYYGKKKFILRIARALVTILSHLSNSPVMNCLASQNMSSCLSKHFLALHTHL